MKAFHATFLVLCALSVTFLFAGCSSSEDDASTAVDVGSDTNSSDSGTPSDSGTTDSGTVDTDTTDSGAGGGADHEEFLARMRECGLISAEGDFSAAGLEFQAETTDQVECTESCIVTMECDTLEQLLCTGGEAATRNACIAGCVFDFSCADGGSTSANRVCDSYIDCGDGSDESACEPSACADGSGTLLSGQVCDLIEDCADGSDEVDCDNLFECAEFGGPIFATYECTGRNECSDGSDEHINCAQVTASCSLP